MSVRLGSVQAVVVSSPDAASEILHKHNAHVADRPAVDAVLANSLIGSPPSARWRALRKLCVTELFAPSRLNALRPMREEKVAELVRHVSRHAARGEPVAVRDLAFTAAMNIMSGALFSVGLDSGPSDREFKDAVKEATVLVVAPNVSDFFHIFKRW
ncbi:hypothetical protein PR202_gb13600 [Eleusine coracana subsp. coracana]|uniref:Uncharacterized protein n=1 Tax=Eleusine coracana subsp. coracana TaxID=191504 RepID=A0AAV5EQX8_ELECO|nr:hypothetical protein QOZ80_9BG0717280 [Eleusine coracana subsp. coracana]GJN25734.1 hypothetical protein PR202_gb13600 [Eleusine coracana subsp. coracana]